MVGKIKNFIVNGEDYFIAEVDDGRLRVGLRSVVSVDLPENHEFFDMAACAKYETEAESIFDNLAEKGLI